MQRTEINVTTGESVVINLTPEEVSALQATAIANFPNEKIAFITQIDADADALIHAVIGERSSEYELAEKEATAYKAAGYAGAVPSSVSAWATAKNWTATQAADSIALAATEWRSAQATMRAARLLCKEQGREAIDAAALDAIKAQWAASLAALKTSLGV